MLNKGMFSSDSDEWETPQPLFDKWNERYGFTIDLAATADNAKCERFYTKEDDALSKDWSKERGWLNPPYGRKDGRNIAWWIRKARDSAQAGALIVMLIPARTDTKPFHRYIWNREGCKPRPGVWVDFMPSRREFTQPGKSALDKNNTAPFPSMVVVFHPGLED